MSDTVLIGTVGLLSKWGFGDGDMLDDILWDWADEAGRGLPNWSDDEQHSWEHRVLVRVVREFVLPVIDQDVRIYEIGTIHNPIRAETLNGEPWNDYTTDTEGRVTPEWVEVPVAEVLRIAEEEHARYSVSGFPEQGDDE